MALKTSELQKWLLLRLTLYLRSEELLSACGTIQMCLKNAAFNLQKTCGHHCSWMLRWYRFVAGPATIKIASLASNSLMSPKKRREEERRKEGRGGKGDRRGERKGKGGKGKGGKGEGSGGEGWERERERNHKNKNPKALEEGTETNRQFTATHELI